MQHISLGVVQDTRSQERHRICVVKMRDSVLELGFFVVFFVCGFVLHLRFELVFQ